MAVSIQAACEFEECTEQGSAVVKLSPYMGVSYQRRFGGTESLTRESGGKVNDVRMLVGLRTWF